MNNGQDKNKDMQMMQCLHR